MSLFNLFSKRQRAARGEIPDVYQYKHLPNPLRVQILHIVNDVVGENSYGYTEVDQVFDFLHRTLCKERGVFRLHVNSYSDRESVSNYFLQEEGTELALDVVELVFGVIDNYCRTDQFQNRTIRNKSDPDDAIEELNARFREHGCGYQFESGEIIRVDSQVIHAEAVKPALALLNQSGFEGANEEFLSAHTHFRHGRHKEALVDCLKSLESTLLAICKIRNWATKPTDTAKNLLAVCFDHGILPTYLDSQMNSLRALLESGVPTVRNKNGGHGQGAAPLAVPEFLARYTLNLTATSILLLVESHQASK